MLIFLHHQPEINNNNNREITLWRNYLVAKQVLFTMLTKSNSLCLECAFASLWRNSSSAFSFLIIVVYPKSLKARKLWGLETRLGTGMFQCQAYKNENDKSSVLWHSQGGGEDVQRYSAWDKGLMREVVCYSFKHVVKGNTRFTSLDLGYSD